MSERTRRQPAVGKDAAKKMGALEALKAARDGTSKRANAYEVNQEERVYDDLPEEEYAQLVSKRRKEGGASMIWESQTCCQIIDHNGSRHLPLCSSDCAWTHMAYTPSQGTCAAREVHLVLDYVQSE